MTRPGSGASAVRRALRRAARPDKIAILSSFFKTGPGEYGAGDRFLGVPVPTQRRIARDHRAMSLDAVVDLLRGPIHEERLTALLILLEKFKIGSPAERSALHRFYVRHLHRVNNWDLVDCSAATLVGEALEGKSHALLDRLARSGNLWDRRVAMIATHYFTKKGDPKPALRLARRLLSDPHDLMHKAVGWMLREVGKRCGEAFLTTFLDRHGAAMPRTALRYAIERFPFHRRRFYLRGGRRG
ncbi:MAG TPA: DNA alkylation repair protein [Elusimicrobiota bacterium]|nr:DNA alkylation repair protein [Elusimicrobiota bacterium]HMX94177.1 DNA alkylation repair protein [Elusimicrobiota bacterium]HNF59305.1 DNA alkylation repair protein [Elusimicrobiota bacterium]HNG45948.1 DNA alkylation repair protein [Elusimicrobiota bacterium]